MKTKTRNTKASRATVLDTSVDEIKYDRVTRDFAVYVEGQFVGYAPNYAAAEDLRMRERSKRLKAE